MNSALENETRNNAVCFSVKSVICQLTLRVDLSLLVAVILFRSGLSPVRSHCMLTCGRDSFSVKSVIC